MSLGLIDSSELIFECATITRSYIAADKVTVNTPRNTTVWYYWGRVGCIFMLLLSFLLGGDKFLVLVTNPQLILAVFNPLTVMGALKRPGKDLS